MEPDAANPVPRRLKLESVLHNNPDGRVASALCSTRSEASAPSRAIVVLSKKPWSDADIRAIVEGSETELNEYHRNDKFSKYDARPPAPINEVSITFICPANDIDIAKYSEQKRHLVRETADVYQTATRPYVKQIPVEQLGWVQAIIDRRKEMDRLMYEVRLQPPRGGPDKKFVFAKIQTSLVLTMCAARRTANPRRNPRRRHRLLTPTNCRRTDPLSTVRKGPGGSHIERVARPPSFCTEIALAPGIVRPAP